MTEHDWAAADLTYQEVGASRLRQLPAGYDVLERQRVVGRGQDRFNRAAEALLTWQLHQGAGLVVQADQDRIVVGTHVRLGLGCGGTRNPARRRSWFA